MAQVRIVRKDILCTALVSIDSPLVSDAFVYLTRLGDRREPLPI